MTKTKKIIFLTGTRADFGKLKSLIDILNNSDLFECYIFVTGMHTLSKYGSTFHEIEKYNYKNVFVFMNQTNTTDQDIILANTITGFSNFVKEIHPDMIVVHGDRVEGLAGALVGSFNNILVSHIEGGEISGTIDELIRHAITKLSHAHFVSNTKAKQILVQLGESKENIFVIGSPDIEVMKNHNLSSINKVTQYYNIQFNKYAILIFHPVTTELDLLKNQIREVVSAVTNSQKNYVVIYPNNDAGTDIILEEYKNLETNPNFIIFPSLRFEYFLSLLKHSEFIIGNSSTGIREAEVFGIPSINIGSRQQNRSNNTDIVNVTRVVKDDILKAIKGIKNKKYSYKNNFGEIEESSERFFQILKDEKIWKISLKFCLNRIYY